MSSIDIAQWVVLGAICVYVWSYFKRIDRSALMFGTLHDRICEIEKHLGIHDPDQGRETEAEILQIFPDSRP